MTGVYYANLNITTDSLATIDPLTGIATPIGPSDGFFVQSLAFDPDGRLFGIGRDSLDSSVFLLYEIDTLTAAILSTVSINTNFFNPGFDNSLAIDPLTGLFYTAAAIEGGLYQIDPLTGDTDRIGSTGQSNIRALDFALFDVPEPPPPATIDIKPGSDPNSVNPRSNGVIPVAVLGSMGFDAMQVSYSTVTFGPDDAPPKHDGHVEDVNDDGYMDMMFYFKTQETGIVCGDTEATLTGETFEGIHFTGTDTMKTVGCN